MEGILLLIVALLVVALVGTQLQLRRQKVQAADQTHRLEMLRKAISAVKAGYFHYKVTNNETYWDEPSLRMFGLSGPGRNIVPGTWESLIHPEDLDAALTKILDVLNGRQNLFTHSYRIILPDNSIRWIEGTGFVIRDSDKKPIEITGFHFDVTQQRTNEATLRESESRAVQSMHARTEFLANMSHEIRTPLNAIVGMIELLNLEKPTPIQKRYLSTLQNSSDVLLRIINDILDVSKIDEGKLKLEDELFTLREVLNQCIAVYTQASEFKDIFLSGFIDPKVPILLKGDSTRLQQVIMNLVGNAFKFTDSGHIILRVVPEDNHSIRFSVTDTGTGIEAEAIEHLFERFSQAQMSTTRKFGGTGLGLTIVKQIVELWGGEVFVESQLGKGSTFSFILPLHEPIRECTPTAGKYLVGTRHDALISLWQEDQCAPEMVRAFNETELMAALEDSSFTHVIVEQRFTETKGSELLHRAKEINPSLKTILIGFEKHVQQDSNDRSVDRFQPRPYFVNELWDSTFKNASSFVPTVDTKWPDYSHLSVLCVDDNQSNLMVISGLLKRFGIKAQCVSSGTKAIERAAQTNFDLVLMDYEMPDINGPSATREILKLKPMLIIGLSAHTGDNFQHEAVESGMQGYLRKPVRIAALDDLLGQHFRSATASQSEGSDRRAAL